MKEITLIIDTDGTTTLNLKGYERQSPEIAALFEKELGQVKAVDWNPKAHVHTHNGITHRH